MRKCLTVVAIAVSAAIMPALAPPATAQSFAVDTPAISIGVNLNSYPSLVRIPGYPVYYAPSVGANYFFYDGLYWVFDGTNWYASTWYDGPWGVVSAYEVPVFLLRVPVRYYVRPPVYFRGWSVSGPPRWGEHWGRRWSDRHRNWDRWNRASVPAPAPLPTYQRQYTGNRYPTLADQHALESRHYHYRPRDRVAQQVFTARVRQAQAAPQQRGISANAQTRAQSDAQRAQRQAQSQRQTQTRREEQARARQPAQSQRTQQAQVRQQEQAQLRQRSQAQRNQQAQARSAQQARERSQAQRTQQAQAQRTQHAQAQRAQQAQAQRNQQAQARSAQQAQARERAQAQRSQQAQAQRSQQARAQRSQQVQAQAQRSQQAQARQQMQARQQQAKEQRGRQDATHARDNARREEHNG
jgi:hypothetical protein